VGYSLHYRVRLVKLTRPTFTSGGRHERSRLDEVIRYESPYIF